MKEMLVPLNLQSKEHQQLDEDGSDQVIVILSIKVYFKAQTYMNNEREVFVQVKLLDLLWCYLEGSRY